MISGRIFLRIFISLLMLSGSNVVCAQDGWPRKASVLYQGFIDSIHGEYQDFLQNLKPGNVALLANGATPDSFIIFESQAVPKSYNEEYVTFIWAASITKANPAKVAKYDLSIEGKKTFSFQAPTDPEHASWTLKNADGTELFFVFTHHGFGDNNIFGYMLLNIKSNLVPRNKNIKFRVIQTTSGPGDLFMAFQDSLHNECNVFGLPSLEKTNSGNKQPLLIECVHIGNPVEAEISMDGRLLAREQMKTGKNTFQYYISPVLKSKTSIITIKTNSYSHSKNLVLQPLKLMEIYLLPHSHVDVGFTHVQDTVEKMQWQNFETGIALSKATQNYPPEARSKWNVEVMWAVEGYLKQASPEKKAEFIDAVKKGWIGLDANYGNMLTGIQTPEEMIKNNAFANQFEKDYGVKTETAMVSDVPGANWGIVTALAQNEIKYVSLGPNHMPHMPDHGYQVGHTLKTWGDLPFYWISPSGKEKVLVWMSRHGYSWFHPWLLGTLANSRGTAVLKFLEELQNEAYPYDMVQVRYTLGDNAGPDAGLPDFVKEWNEKHITPKFIIATNKEMFDAFERKYADIIPSFSGDFSPYWEDGTSSSALETALNRHSSEKLVQVQSLYAMQKTGAFPKAKFDKAWRNIVLFSEHTWGSYSSKSHPDGQLALDQWAVKQKFALDAESITADLLADILAPLETGAKTFELVNTLSWKRSELVRLPNYWPGKQIKLFNASNEAVPVQLLESGEWTFLAKDIPPNSSLKYRVEIEGKQPAIAVQDQKKRRFGDDEIKMELNPISGTLNSLRYHGLPFNLIDSLDQFGWDGYWYTGINAQNPKKAISKSWKMTDNGPVIQKFRSIYSAPGAASLDQEMIYIPGLDYLEVVNLVDKTKVLKDENVRFSFPFHVPNARIRMDQQWGMMEPGKDQLAGANQNFHCTERWIDFSNDQGGLCWISLDAPIVEFKEMQGQMWASDLKTRPWLDSFPGSTRLFSWVMNNVWFVNYKGYQEGKVRFRYLIKPHSGFDIVQTNQFAIGAAQPLLIGNLKAPSNFISNYQLNGDPAIIASSFKPSDDGKGWILRVWNCSDKKAQSKLNWTGSQGAKFFRSNGKEKTLEAADAMITLDPWETKTIRVEK